MDLPGLLQRLLTITGSLGLGFVGLAYLDSLAGSNRAVAAFESAVAEQRAPATPLESTSPDQSLWSEKRIAEYNALDDDAVPLALLEIDRLGLQVPVYPGTDRVTLNRGAGIVEGTAYPDEAGNIVLSAHRDGFFRPLKDIELGDILRVRTLRGDDEYVVEEIFITDPLDVSVLSPSDSPMVTLVTCYPFYYVGFAPDRLIVRARPISHAIQPVAGDAQNSSRDDTGNNTIRQEHRQVPTASGPPQ